jgi:hypothetical protein
VIHRWIKLLIDPKWLPDFEKRILSKIRQESIVMGRMRNGTNLAP